MNLSWLSKNAKYYVLLSLVFIFPPLLFSLVVLADGNNHVEYLKFIIAENFIFAGLIFFLGYFLIPRRYRNYSLVLSYVILSLSVFFQSSYIHLYSYEISESTFFILLETNINETLEYLQHYFSFFNIIFILALFIPGLLLFYLIRKGAHLLILSKTNLVVSSLLFLSAFLLYTQKDLERFNFYMMAWHSYNRYEEQLSKYREFGLHEAKGNFEDVTRHKASSSREIYVLVIGESTTKHHMGVYGYPRKTTPRLSRIEDELFIFKNVISPHTHTIPSLSKLLTLKNYENEEGFKKGSIIQLMNQAGFKTAWLSNQSPIGIHENLITRIAQASSEIHFTPGKTNHEQNVYDNAIFKPLERVLEEDGDLFIVIHLLGTHIDYRRRYPEHFDRFSGSAPLKVSEEGNEVINSYDNAVLYNDFVLSSIIEKVRSKNTSSWVLYLSDHGEDVYRVNNSASHSESFGTYPMYDVPFILWTSPFYKMPGNVIIEQDRNYMLDDLIYSLADLSGITFRSYEQERSIFNKSFKPRKRQIYNLKEYDSIFKKNP